MSEDRAISLDEDKTIVSMTLALVRGLACKRCRYESDPPEKQRFTGWRHRDKYGLLTRPCKASWLLDEVLA